MGPVIDTGVESRHRTGRDHRAPGFNGARDRHGSRGSQARRGRDARGRASMGPVIDTGVERWEREQASRLFTHASMGPVIDTGVERRGAGTRERERRTCFNGARDRHGSRDRGVDLTLPGGGRFNGARDRHGSRGRARTDRRSPISVSCFNGARDRHGSRVLRCLRSLLRQPQLQWGP